MIPVQARQEVYDEAVARADEVMPRWLDARAAGLVPASLEDEARTAEADVRRAASKLERARRKA